MNIDNGHMISSSHSYTSGAQAGAVILVIEDTESVLTMFKMLLSDLDYNVLTAETGGEGKDLFLHKGADLVLCDLALPDQDGWSVARFIRDLCERNNLPKPVFLIMTGWVEEMDSFERMEEYGVDEVLVKPVNTNHLLETLEERLAGKRTDRGRHQ